MNRTDEIIMPGAILAVAAREWGLTGSALKSKWRTRDISRARSVALAIMQERMTWSYPQLARAVGMRSHTSAIHAAKRGAALLAEDPKLAERLRLGVDAELANRRRDTKLDESLL